MNLPVIIKFVIDLLAVLLLALGIKGLSKVKSARDANRLAAFAMSLSVVGLLSYYLGTSGITIQSWIWIIIGSITKVSLKVCKSPPIQGKTSRNGLFFT